MKFYSHAVYIALTGLIAPTIIYLLLYNLSDTNYFLYAHGKYDWKELVYFSVVTFTTVGYGDISPLSWAKGVAMVQAILGPVTVGYLVLGRDQQIRAEERQTTSENNTSHQRMQSKRNFDERQILYARLFQSYTNLLHGLKLEASLVKKHQVCFQFINRDGFSSVNGHYYDQKRRDKLFEEYLIGVLEDYKDNHSLRPVYLLHRMLILHMKNLEIHVSKDKLHDDTNKNVRKAIESMMLKNEGLTFQMETINEALEHKENVDHQVGDYIRLTWDYFLTIEYLMIVLFSHPSIQVMSDEHLLRTRLPLNKRDYWLDIPYNGPKFWFTRELGYSYLGEKKARY